MALESYPLYKKFNLTICFGSYKLHVYDMIWRKGLLYMVFLSFTHFHPQDQVRSCKANASILISISKGEEAQTSLLQECIQKVELKKSLNFYVLEACPN